MTCRFYRCVLVGVYLAVAATTAYAQGGTTSTISGIVVDSGGGVVPGADVLVTHNATNTSQSAVSNAQGAFSFPGLNIGTYTVAVTLSGFKTYIATDVVLTSGAPASIRAVLEIGGVAEQVTVSSTSEIVQTQSTTISSTINTNQIMKLPITSRSAMDFVTLLPGVTTAGGNRQSQINGLPRGAINITLDGVNIQDNTLRSTDGFFAIVSPRLDAIEEVTVTTATQGAESAQGGVQIKFVTRSGTNAFSGSGYHYFRSDKLNANTWFNNRNGVDKVPLKQNQSGVRAGGPIILPGLFDGRNKAFFFFNYEEFRQPGGTTRNRTILSPEAQQGLFRYSSGGTIREVNLLALAAANGQIATLDPTTSGLLADIRNAVSGGPVQDIDNRLQRFTFNVSTESLRRYPTGRVDYNLTDNHRFSSAFNYNYFTDFPDTLNNRDFQFPGFPVEAGQSSERLGFSNSLRSTLNQNLVNEVRVGYSGAPVTFFKEMNAGMYNGSVANTQGYHVVLGRIGTAAAQDLTNTGAAPAPQSRNATSLLIEDTMTWLKGKHSLSMGGSWTQYELWAKNSALVPQINFGVVNGDPAQNLFTAANFPGAAAADLTAAQNLYALLTGRVSTLTGDARINESTGEYEFMGTGTQRARMREAGFFAQDSWRIRPDFTINLGLRYELQFPFTPLNDSYSTATLDSFCGVSGQNPGTVCNLFRPGLTPGVRPEFINFGKGTPAFNTDYNNWAPSVGFAWTLSGAPGVLGKLVGQDGDTVVRAGFTRAFSREGMNAFSSQFNANPGVVIADPSRSLSLGNLDNDGLGLPVLFRDSGRVGPAAFPLTPQYPLTDVVTQDINLFDENIQVPYVDSWSAGIQRALGRNMAVEVRYVGTRARDNWQTLNYNEINIFENGFLNEFRLAQQNLQANVAAGLASQGFRYRGPGTGTVPLPIILAYFRGAGDPNNAALYTSNLFTNNTFLTPLARFNPNPFGFADSLDADAARRANALAAGLPANFLVANPDLLGGADLTTNVGRSNYHSLQLELRRRLAQGLQFSTSYVFGNMQIHSWETHRRGILMLRDTGTPGDISHVFKFNAVYDLPFGQGRRFGGNVNGVVDRLIGGWSLSLVSRVQSGRLVDLGNVRLVGMTGDDVRSMYKVRIDHADQKIWMLPQDVIDETIKAFSVSATSPTGYGALGAPSGRYFAPANGPDCIEPDAPQQNATSGDYGECGVRSLVVTGPLFQEHDITIAKRVNLFGRTNFEFRLELLNAFNNHNFVPVGGLGSAIASYEVTGLNGVNTSRVLQLVSRINW